MPVSLEQAYGATAVAKKKKSDETNFFSAAAAGVASGLIKIPAGFVSLGAELVDLGLGTELASDFEDWFDDLNPFDDVAETRTIGKITEALAMIGPVAVKGASLGIQAANKLRATALARRALAAKQAGKAVKLSNFGRIIHKGEDLLTTPLAGGVIGSGIGEALVTDEDIGTLGDMLKGTSLEPFAITMMNTEDKEGRADAFRRLTNRLKFGAEGALFNLGIAGAAKGVKKLRTPSTYGLDRWAEGGFMEEIERYFLYGLKPAGPGTQAMFESKRTMLDAIQATKIEAKNQVHKLNRATEKIVPTLDSSLDLSKEAVLKEVQDILQPFPGKKIDTMPLEELSKLIEQKSGIQNIARDKWKYEYPDLKLNKLGERQYENYKKLSFDPVNKLGRYKTKEEFLNDLIEAKPENLKKYTVSSVGTDPTRRLITPEKTIGERGLRGKKIIGERGLKGFFDITDYTITKDGKAYKFLEKIRKESGTAAADEFETILKNMRATVDNLTGKISQKNLKINLSRKLHAELGNYLTADYLQFNQHAIPFFRVSRNTAKLKEKALTSYVEQAKNAYRAQEHARTGKPLSSIEVPARYEQQAVLDGEAKIERTLKAKNIDEIDPINTDVIEETTGKAVDKKTARIESDAITVQTSVIKRKKLDEWQEILLGRIKDPRHTFLNSVNKMATLNSTIDYMDNIVRAGSKKGGMVRNVNGVDKFFNSIGEEINIGELTKDNISKGRIKEKFYNNEGVYYTPEQTRAIAQQETEELLKSEFDRAQFIFGKGDAPGQTASGAQALVDAGKAANLNEATIMLKDSKQFKKVKSTGVDGLSALDGKWIKAPMYEALFDTTNQWLNTSKMGMLYKYAILVPKTISQISKTVLNALTHVRNFLSAGAFVSANGAIIPTGGDLNAILPKSSGGLGVFGRAGRMSLQRLKGKMDPHTMDWTQRGTRVGVSGGTQVQVGEYGRTRQDILKEIYTSPALAESKTNRALLEVNERLKKWYKIGEDMYVEEDNFWKNANWFLERNRFETTFEKLGIDATNFKGALNGTGVLRNGKRVSRDVQNFLNDSVERFYDKSTKTFNGNYELFLDEVGGKITRNNVPNYAYVGRTGRALRLSPFGNFIAFPLEIMRTGSNIIDQSIREMTSKIPEIAALGKKRFASFALTVGAVPQVTREAFKAMHNVSNEEMDALRRVVPEWSKNSTLIPTGRDKNGYLKYVDFSYSNAYDTLIRPVQAVWNAIAEGKNDAISLKASLGSGLQQGAREILEPFASESIFTEALIDSVIRDGRGRDGKKVWSEADEPFVKIAKGIAHIGGTMIPMESTFRQLGRLEKAARGKTGKLGEEFSLRDELPGLWGFRSVQSNPERSLIYRTTDFAFNLKKAENLFTSPLLKGGRVSPEDILSRYQYSEARRFHELKQMAKDIEAMRHLGMPDYKIKKELEKRRGLSKDVARDLMLGTYTPKRPSSFFVERMNEINRDLNQKEGRNVPNPYSVALPSIFNIMDRNRRINLFDENVKFTELGAEGMAKGGRVGMQDGGELGGEPGGDRDLAAGVWITEPEPVKQSFGYDFEKYYASGIWMQKIRKETAGRPSTQAKHLPPTPPVNPEAMKDPMVNTNLMQTGLTQTEQALLSNEEKSIRLRQRGMSA